MLTLAIGDLFIPDRALDIPQKFRKLLAPPPGKALSKIAQVLCLGNITNSLDTLKFLHNLSPSFHLVRGEFDDAHILGQQLSQLNGEENLQTLPSYKIIQHDNLKIGFTNGYQIMPKNDALSLLSLARELDVDVLVWGGTHKVEAYILDGKFFINPGSATGAFSLDWSGDDEEEEEEEDEEPEQEEERKEEEILEQAAQLNLDDSPEQQPKEMSQLEETTDEVDKTDELAATQEEVVTPKREIKDDESFTDEDINIGEIQNIPSFCLLDTNGSTCTLYIYTYLEDEVKVDKVTYNKEEYA